MAGILISLNSYCNGTLGLRTVVVDAGHGGTDPGAVSQDRKTYEKNLTLDISIKLAAKIREACPDVKVILSRPDDKFVPLNDRADCANKADADLFISIHINSTKSTSPHGYSVHVLGQSSNKDRDLFAYNMDVCKRENSVILMEDEYNTKYQGFDPSDPESFIFMQLMQNSHLEQSLDFAQIISDKLAEGPINSNKGIWQNPFLVLWRTAMPSVLVELGFISNASDLSVLRNSGNRDRIADCLCEAFVKYKKDYDSSISIGKDSSTNEPVATARPVQPELEQNSTGVTESSAVKQVAVIYGTQIMAGKVKLSPKDKKFLGYEPQIIEVNGIYKYVIGCSESKDEAVENYRKIRSVYKDAFLVRISNGIFPL